jgi:hypothetical protein
MSKSNETIYETDFKTGKVKEIYANYHGDPYSFSTEYPLEEKLSKEVKRLSKVSIRNIDDVYHALTERQTSKIFFCKILYHNLKLIVQSLYRQYTTHCITDLSHS